MQLLSWNIQWARGIDGRVDSARILRCIRHLGSFDVICLQEIAVNFPGLPGGDDEDQIAELSAGLPGYIPVFGIATDVPDGRGGRSLFGNVIFSRLPVGQVWRHLLPWQAELATPSMQRVLVEAVVTADFGPIRVLTTHLEYYSRRQRDVQIDAIRHLHGEACSMARRHVLPEEQGGTFEVFSRPEQAVLCGDFNFPAHAPEYARILAPFHDDLPAFCDAWSALNPGISHPSTVGIHPVNFIDRPECFDFIFVTDGLIKYLNAFGTDSVTEASDHQPVWIALTAATQCF